MVGRIWRQIPRILIATALGLLSLLLFIGLAPDGAGFRHLLTPAGLALMIALSVLFWGTLISGLALWAPRFLELGESLALALVILALLAAALPDVRLPASKIRLLLAVLTVCSNLLAYGPQWQSRLGDVGPMRFRFTSPHSAEQLWPKLFPDAARIEQYMYGNAEIAPMPGAGANDWLLTYPWGGSATGKLTSRVQVSEVQPLRHFVIRWKTFRPAGELGPGEDRETMRVTLAPHGRGTRVEIDLTIHGLPLGTRLALWVGNHRAEIAASYRLRAEGRPDPSLAGHRFAPSAPLSV